METHLRQDLRDVGRGSEAYWSAAPDGRAAIFVHGFGGEALTTWEEFDRHLPRHPKAAGADLVFYGYEGVKGHISLSADLFYRFLDALATTPKRFPAPPVQRPVRFRYRSLTIVAHSMGAIVARRALLLAVKASRPWVRRVKLVLFAPAHAGVRAVALVRECGDLVTMVGVLTGMGKFVSPAYDDLSNPNTFMELSADTVAVLATSYRSAFKATRIIFGATENVVLVQTFCEDPMSPDPNFIAVHGKGHTTVCKPTASYRLPLDVVTAVL